MVRILHIIDRPGPGGAERMFAETLAVLKRRGNTENAGCFLCAPEGTSGASAIGRTDPRERHTAFRIAKGILEFPALLRTIRKENPDVIYAYHPSLCILVAAAAGRLLGRKVAARRFAREDALGPFSRLADRISYALCHSVVALSEDSAGDLSDIGLPSKKICIIRNGKDPAVYKSSIGKIGAKEALGVSGRFVFGMAGRITPLKGQETAVRAFARLAEKRPEARLVIAGSSGDERYRSRILEFIGEQGLAGKVVFTGHMPDIGSVLAAFDVFVHASTSEGFPSALLEAMSVGLPVIAADHGPNAETLGQAGVLVPSGDEGALASAMERLISDPALRKSLGAESGQRARGFSADAMAAKYEDLFIGLAARP